MSTSALSINYVQNFPTEVPTKAAQGFIATAAISLICGCAANVALLGGVIAATATLIEAITRPIIRAIFPENPLIAESIQICIPRLIAPGLVNAIATPWMGISYKTTSLILPLIAWISLNNQFYERNVAIAQVF